MSKISSIIDKCIDLLKVPVAIIMLLILVPSFQLDFMLVKKMMNMHYVLNFFLPMGVVIIFFLIMPGLSGSFFAIAEHELTHMLFAVLTLHKPKGLDIDQDVGGSFSFVGKGNWLIALAPYFFPTFTFVLMAGLVGYVAIYGKLPDYHLILFGIFIGYHLIVTLFEIHPKQTDFEVAGPIFSICFIPGANLLIYGMLFAYLQKGWLGMLAYYVQLWHHALTLIGMA